MEIAGSTILITGGASGIGLESARRFAASGARVVAVDRDREAIYAVGDGEGLGDVEFVACDVAVPDEVDALFTRLYQGESGIDAVVNNAAILRDQTLVSKLGKRLKKHSVEDWQATLDSNLTGTFLVAREAAARWIEDRRGGVIVNTSSVVRTGNPGQSAYAATKAAVDSLTVTWAKELAPYKIRVAAIAHGFAETGMTERIPPYFREQIRQNSLVGRYAAPAELAQGVEFILANDYFSARVLELDGGMRF
ncbi:MAG: SDR family oxidoreductase [Pseudomonadota bacterium]